MVRIRRRRKIPRLKLKKNSVYAIFSIFLAGGAIITLLSYFQNGTMLDLLKDFLLETFGWGGLLFPLVLGLLAAFFSRIKSPLTKTHVPIGTLLTYISLLAIARTGMVGKQIWLNFSSLVSGFGAFVILLGMISVGLIVLFNTSLEETVRMFKSIYKQLQKILQPMFFKKKSPFAQKLPIKPPIINQPFFKTEMHKENELNQGRVEKKSDKSTTSVDPGTTIISNIKTTDRIWEYPPVSLLSSSPGQKANRGDVRTNSGIIEKTLDSFGISARVAEVNEGPAVAQYCIEIAMGTKLSKITALQSDLALALAAPQGQIRIEAPIPGRNLVGIEIPNISSEYVTLKEMLSTDSMKKSKNKLVTALGLDVSGKPVTLDITKMPHVLIAGTTGSGKSVLINSWISSLLFRTTPSEVRMILIDPKRVELTPYDGIPHLLTPVIVEPDKILSALKWTIHEMERRYKVFAEMKVRNIDGYNAIPGFESIPYIVIFIDELADLMSYSPVEVEDAICRLAQMARATGIHLVLSTQRPSVEVITGLIKGNVPARIAFNVSSMIDSRVILDTPGAEKLLGKGDMLYIPPDQAKPKRIQGTFVSEKDVLSLVEFHKNKNMAVEYTEEVTAIPAGQKISKGTFSQVDDKDSLFDDALRIVCQYDKASASLLQRRLSIGYARAARILDQLEREEIVSAGEGAKPREVLVKSIEEYYADKNQPEETTQ